MNTATQIVEALNSFEPGNVDTANVSRLYDLLEGFKELPEREQVMPAMFSLLERYPGAEFGSPGPIVHTLESTPGYEPLLELSLARQPTDLTVWMVNRILNAAQDTVLRQRWLLKLQEAWEHPKASEHVREVARRFLERENKQ